MNHSKSTQTNERKKRWQLLPDAPINEAFVEPVKSATQEAIDRLEYDATGLPIEVNGEGERLDENGVPINEAESSFKSELEFSGYQNIEDEDNDAYNSIVDEQPKSEEELKFTDRTQEENGEENAVDPQENKKNSNL